MLGKTITLLVASGVWKRVHLNSLEHHHRQSNLSVWHSGNRYKPNRTIVQPKKRARSPPPRPLPPADHINNPNAKQRGKAYSSNNLGDGPASSTSSSSYQKCSHCDVLSHELRYPLNDGCELGVCRTCLTNPKLFLSCEWCGDAVFTPTKRKFSKREIAEREATGSCLHNFQTYKW